MTSLVELKPRSHRPSPRNRSEQAFVLNAYKRLRRLHVPSRWEAPLLGRSIDLLFRKDDYLISVEFKHKNWQRGIVQARDHLLGVDFAYICFLGKAAPLGLHENAIAYGIGLFKFEESSDWPFSVSLAAKRSEYTWPVARDNLMQSLKIA